MELGARARRGNLVLHKLKKNPHEIADFIGHAADYQGALEIITSRPVFQDVLVADNNLGTTKSNGTFVIDTDTQGVPVLIRKKIIISQPNDDEHENDQSIEQLTL